MIILLILLFLLPIPAWATTYYVATTGSDSNDGSSGSPWLTLQKCAAAPVAAGDTCIVRDGTYSVAGRFLLLITSSQGSASGTAASPITIKAENLHGAKLTQTTGVGQATTIYVSRPYYIIDGFEIDGTGVTYDTGSTTNHSGVAVYSSNVTVRHMHIHDIARTQCSNSPYGNAGLFLGTGTTNVTFELNLIHTVGRLRNGESGCSTSIFQHDHGIYITRATDLTIRRNVIYDTNRGYPINIYHTSTDTHTRYKIYHNTIAGRSPTGVPNGQIVTGGIWVDGEIKNNLFYQPDADRVINTFNLSASSSGNVVSYNRTNVDLPGSAPLWGTSTPAGFTYSNNTENSTIGFTDAACTQSDGGCENDDFTLAASANAIDSGTNVSLPYNGSAPDQGAFETFSFSACEVPVGEATTIRATWINNVNPPLLPASSITGVTARKNTVSNTITASARVGDGQIDFTTTNSYAGGDTADISASSTNITDSALIGGTLNQPWVGTLSNQSCTNNITGVSYTFTQAAYEFRYPYGTEAGAIVLPWGSSSAENFSGLKVRPNGKVRIRFSIVCDGASGCPDTAFYLYSYNGSSYELVPDSFSTQNIAFCGADTTDIPVNGSATTDQLSTSGTFRAGGFVSSANAIPTVTGLLDTNKTEMEYCVKFDTDASGSYSLRMGKQDGSALTYTNTASLVITPDAAGGAGF